jgi:hypothetical protein
MRSLCQNPITFIAFRVNLKSKAAFLNRHAFHLSSCPASACPMQSDIRRFEHGIKLFGFFHFLRQLQAFSRRHSGN